jgi:hypothetical protein
LKGSLEQRLPQSETAEFRVDDKGVSQCFGAKVFHIRQCMEC